MAGINISTLVREAEAQLTAAKKHLERVKSMAQEVDKLAREGVSLRGSSKSGFKSALKSKTGKSSATKSRRGAPRGKRTGPTISDHIYDVVAEGSNMASGDVIRELQRRRPGTKPPSVYTTLNKLKKEGKLGQEGGKWQARGGRGGFGGRLA